MRILDTVHGLFHQRAELVDLLAFLVNARELFVADFAFFFFFDAERLHLGDPVDGVVFVHAPDILLDSVEVDVVFVHEVADVADVVPHVVVFLYVREEVHAGFLESVDFQPADEAFLFYV